jgi:hypothetical protein
MVPPHTREVTGSIPVLPMPESPLAERVFAFEGGSPRLSRGASTCRESSLRGCARTGAVRRQEGQTGPGSPRAGLTQGRPPAGSPGRFRACRTVRGRARLDRTLKRAPPRPARGRSGSSDGRSQVRILHGPCSEARSSSGLSSFWDVLSRGLPPSPLVTGAAVRRGGVGHATKQPDLHDIHYRRRDPIVGLARSRTSGIPTPRRPTVLRDRRSRSSSLGAPARRRAMPRRSHRRSPG